MEVSKIMINFAGMKQILIVDDEHDLCDILSFNLRKEGYATTVAYSAEQALEIIESNNALKGKGFNLILLDVMMEGMSGFDMAKKLQGAIPIIFLTAKDTEEDLLTGFGLGADDYISKPFSVREMLARVNAVINRTTNEASEAIIYKGLVIDFNTKAVYVEGRDVNCTRTEQELLTLLINEHGRVFSRKELIERVWPKDVIVTNRTVDVNITRLRKKIGNYAANIVTRQGYGYCFEK